MKKPVLNIDDIELMDFSSSSGKFHSKLGRMGPALGAEKLGAMLTIIEPGARAFPLHAHHAIEEMFFIIEGTGEYRIGKETYPVRQGDLLSAPSSGADGAHQIINTGSTPLKFLAFSTMDTLDIVEYPESKKFRIYSAGKDENPQNARMNVVLHHQASVDLFEGEED